MATKPRLGLFIFVAAQVVLVSVGIWLAQTEFVPDEHTIKVVTEQHSQPDRPVAAGQSEIPEKALGPPTGLPPTAFPVDRVRQRSRGLEPLRIRNRIVIRSVSVTAAEEGVSVSGEILTDFCADGHPVYAALPGYQLPVEVDVQLYFRDVEIEHDHNGEPMRPWMGVDASAHLVETQQVTVAPKFALDGFGLCQFEFPALPRPLAPGFYELRARVEFAEQSPSVQQGMKWCTDWYGHQAHPEYVRSSVGSVGLKTVVREVLKDERLHTKYHTELLGRVKGVEDHAFMIVGDLLFGRRVHVVELTGASVSWRPNLVVWTSYHELIRRLLNIQQTVGFLQQELRLPRKSDVPFSEKAERFREIRRDAIAELEAEIAAAGASPQEAIDLLLTESAIGEVLVQVDRFQGELRGRYRYIVDGLFRFRGWQPVLDTGAAVAEALQTQAMPPYHLPRENNAIMEKLWENEPKDIRELALEYLLDPHGSDPWHPNRFLTDERGWVEFDPGSWTERMERHVREFREGVKDELNRVATTTRYANEVWRERRDRIANAWKLVAEAALAWEFELRTKQMGESPDTVKTDWRFRQSRSGSFLQAMDLEAIEIATETHRPKCVEFTHDTR